MHLQTIIHSVAIFGIENAAAHLQDSRAKFHTKAQFVQRIEPCLGIARGFRPHKASAAQAVAAFFTRVFYHTPERLSSIFMRFFEILCLRPPQGSPLGRAGAKRLRGQARRDRAALQRSAGASSERCYRCACDFPSASLPSPSPSVTPLPKGEALASRNASPSLYTFINSPSSSE